MTTSDLQQRYQLAQRIAKEAGQLTLEYFQTKLDVDRKGDGSPVTRADREAEELLRRRISETFPDDGILGEEHGEQAGQNGFRWILDPIDGTKSFISGVPLYTTLIGVVENEQPQIGVIEVPALGEMICGMIGEGAWYHRPGRAVERAQVSATSHLAEAVFLTSERETFDERQAGEAYARLERASRLTRTWGDAYGYLMIATGRAELMVDARLNVWDAAAVLPVVTEAGGTFTDWQGQRTIYAEEAIATNGPILDEVLAVTRAYPSVS